MDERIAVYVFTGFNRKLIGRSRKEVKHTLADWGIDCFLFFDPDKVLYLNGAEELPGHAATAEFIAARMRDYDRNIFLGASAGGFAALNYGSLLKADHIIGLAPFTRFDAAAHPHDPRGRKRIPDLWAAEPDDRRRNVMTLLEERAYRGSIVIFYSDRHEPDRFQCRSLDAYPDVSFVEMPAEQHSFFREANYTFRDCFAQAAQILGLPIAGRRPAAVAADQTRGD